MLLQLIEYAWRLYGDGWICSCTMMEDICILHMSKSKEQHQKLSNSMSDEDHAILMEESRPDGRNGRGDRCGNRLLPTMDEFDEMMTNGYPMQINFM